MDEKQGGSRIRNRARAARRGAGVLALVGLALPMAARAGCEITTFELPVNLVGSRAIATVGINGTPVPLAVDSGAFFSMLTEAAAAQLKLPLRRDFDLRVQGLTGRVEAYTTRVDKLQLLKGEIPKVDFVVGGNEPGAGAMGFMGRNMLSIADTEYDLAHGVVRLVFPKADCARADMAYWAGSSPVATLDLLRDSRDRRLPAVRARARLNGTDLVVLFDSGATSVVSARAARHAGVSEAMMTPAGSMYGAGRGTARMWTAAFGKFELGDESILNNRLLVADFDLTDADMLLGIDFFLSHRIYVSKQQSKVFFTYNGGAVFAQNALASAAPAAVDADPAASGAQPASADQFARRGAASAARRDYAAALADLDRACELEPASPALFTQRGTIQEAMKHPAQALEDFDKALELDPAQADARARRAGLRFQAKDRDGARADLDVLDKALAAQSPMRLPMARLYLGLDEPAQALAQLNQWLPAHPHENRRDFALEMRCAIRLRGGLELDAALEDCDDAVDADPKNPDRLSNRGWVQWRLGRYAKAAADFDRSLEVRPENAASLYGRGLSKARMGAAAEAEADLAAARRLQPDIDRRAAATGLTAALGATP